MASVSKLSIRGVRAFSPNDTEQVVEFYFPCTIIVGANGCGKTTIIESLKFAVCGALPPGNKAGQAFVHDPKSIGQTVVKAQIKLRLNNRAGKTMVVLRSMEVQQKKTNMSFKQLDGVIRTTDENGNRVNLSHKCTDLDKQMPSYLGVSKAILEHVVFCHQEDASWPLQEGAVLKKRFDDIFDSTRYTKALDVFSKLKKEYASKVKDIKADMTGYAAHLAAARGFRDQIEGYNEQLEDVEQEIKENNEGFKEIEREDKRINEILEKRNEIEDDIEQKSRSLKLKEELVSKTKEMLEEDLTSKMSKRELQSMLNDFDYQIKEQKEEKDVLSHELFKLDRDISDIIKQESQLQSKIGRFQAEKDAQTQRQAARWEKIMACDEAFHLKSVLTGQSLTQQSQTQNTSYHASSLGDLSLTINSQRSSQQTHQLEIPKNDVDEFFRLVKKKKSELEDDMSDKRRQTKRNEDEIMNQISELTGTLKSIEKERSRLKQANQEKAIELADINKKTQGMPRMRKNDIEKAQENATKFAADRDKANNDPRRSHIPTEIRSLEEKIDGLKRGLEEDNHVLAELRETAETQHAISVLKEQIAKDLEELQESVLESNFAFSRFNINAPAQSTLEVNAEQAMDKVMDEISSRFHSLEDELNKASDDCNKLQMAISEKRSLHSLEDQKRDSTRQKMNQHESVGGSIEQVSQMVKDLRAFEEKNSISTPHNVSEVRPDELLDYLDQRLESEESESVEGIQPDLVKKIVKRLKKLAQRDGEVSCPCCERGFDSQDSITVFAQKMNVLMAEDSPLLKADEKSQQSKSNYVKWRKTMTSNMNNIMDYKRMAQEVDEMKKRLKELEKFVVEKSEEHNKAKEKHTELQTEVGELRALLDSAKMWQVAANRLDGKRIQAGAKDHDILMGSSTESHGRDLKTVERDISEKNQKKDEHSEKINRLNKEMSSLNNRITQLSNQAAQFEKLARDKLEKFADVKKMTERRLVLQEEMNRGSKDYKRLHDDIHPVQVKRRKKEDEKERLRNHAAEEEENARKEIETLSIFGSELEALQKQIDAFDSKNDSDSLDQINSRSEDLQNQKKEKEERSRSIKPDLDRLTKALEDQERHKKNLNENINMMNLSTDIRQLATEIELKRMDASNIEGYDHVHSDSAKLESRKSKLERANARLDGRRGEIIENIRSVKRKLSQPDYKNVDKEHFVTKVKFETTSMAVKDIEKFHTALDKALQRLHGIKVAEINTIIRDLWNLTYKGEDITGIQLVSGEDSGSRSTRSYNYRVVMEKGSAQLDMRGRCSAGQRVLASIVIRLALAETFCVNCGCIALDEPTVNLDYHNKRGLAVALAQIIASRAKQSNFQLIMITHDEDFVALLKTELASQTGFSMPEKYFQVRREEGVDGKFYSKIDAIDWDELI